MISACESVQNRPSGEISCNARPKTLSYFCQSTRSRSPKEHYFVVNSSPYCFASLHFQTSEEGFRVRSRSGSRRKRRPIRRPSHGRTAVDARTPNPTVHLTDRPSHQRSVNSGKKMGCCGSKGQYAVEEPGAYEARRERMLEAANQRNAQSAMRGIQNPRSAARLREEQSKPARPSEFQQRKDEQLVRDWGS